MFDNFVDALKFAAEKHTTQCRKGCDLVPYINHPIKVAHMLLTIGKEADFDLLTAALLHDILEDTCTTGAEMREKFGDRVTDIVLEVTDDMAMNYEDRKRSQIKNAPFLSADAKKIKIADKISNIEDMVTYPMTWSHRRKRQYLEWSEKVVKGCRGINEHLDNAFDQIVKEASLTIES